VNASKIINTTYPLGNGRHAAMPIGPAGLETLTLNLDTLCTGRPFEVTNYTGGNPNSSLASYLPGIRDCIFTNGTGNVTELQGSDAFYGSYHLLGNLTVAIPSLHGNDNSVLTTDARWISIMGFMRPTSAPTLATSRQAYFARFPIRFACTLFEHHKSFRQWKCT
jgi:hypothetical protein